MEEKSDEPVDREMDDRGFHLFAAGYSMTLYIYAFLEAQDLFHLKQGK